MYFEKHDNFTIQLCDESNIQRVMLYLKENMSKTHIMANDKLFMDWQYLKNNHYNIIFAENNDKNIVGLIAFIPNSFYSKNIKVEQDFNWLSNWIVSDNAPRGLGLRLLSSVAKVTENKRVGAINVTENAVKIYKMLKYSEGNLNHFFMPNREIKSYSLLKNYSKKNINFIKSSLKLNIISDTDSISLKHCDEYGLLKDKEYFKAKYASHPYYKYYVYSVSNNGFESAIIVFRISEYNNSKILRIIDFYGNIDVLRYIYEELQCLMNKYGCECTEFYQFGIDKDLLEDGGFEMITDEILPYHFEPFCDSNVALNFVINSDVKYIFKGDGDRERPGFLNGK